MKFLFALLAPLTLLATQQDKTPGKILHSNPHEITPSAGPRINDGIDAFITADFIYWTARMDNLGFANTGMGDNTSNVRQGFIHHPNWQWDPGFKAGIGLNLPHDGWDIRGQFTWLYNKASERTRGDNISPLWNISNLQAFIDFEDMIGAIDEAKCKWNIHLNIVDLELGRNYYVSQYLSLRPYTGFKITWQHMKYRILYDILFPSSGSENQTRLRMKNDPDMWGLGIRSGLDTAWHINPTFSIYGDIALTALWAQYDIRRKDSRRDSENNSLSPAPPLDVLVNTVNIKDSFHTLTGVLELGLGIRAEWWFYENCYHFLMQGGWEEQLWINHNQLLKTTFEETAQGDMLVQGFTLKFRFDF